MTQTKRPRIALVVPALEQGGGVPAVARFLAHVIAESGRYELEFVSIPMSARDPQSVRLLSPGSWTRGLCVTTTEWAGVPMHSVGAYLAELETQRYRPRSVLTKLLDQYDLIQVVAGVPAWACVARRASRPVALQVATLTTVEREAVLAATGGLRGLWRRWMTRLVARLDHAALRQVDVALVENAWMHELLPAKGCARVVFAPPGVDTSLFRPAEGPIDEPPYILSVGRFSDPRKNPALLFEAYALVRQSLEATPRLILAGTSSPSRAAWGRARELGIDEHVEFREGLAREELAALYRGARVFVLSSEEEGLGMVILEAMASGVPVVATDCGGPKTAVRDGETGYIVPRGDAPAMASRIQQILEDASLQATLGESARDRALERFSYSVAGAVFLECYDKLLDGQGRVGR